MNNGNYVFGSLFYDLATTGTETGTANDFSSLNDFTQMSIESFAANTQQNFSLQLPVSSEGSDIVLLHDDTPFLRAASGAVVTINLSALSTGEHVFTTKVLNAHFQRGASSPAKVIVID